MTVRCPNCNTEFTEDTAPWLQKRKFCPIHDRLYFVECEFCTPEQRAHTSFVERKSTHDAENEARVNAGQSPVPFEEEENVAVSSGGTSISGSGSETPGNS